MPQRGSEERPKDLESLRLERRARRRAGRREAILVAAREVLVERGAAALTVAEVAETAGISKPAVYYYFRSKEELVGGLVVQALEAEVEVLLEAIERAPTGVEALAALVRAKIDHHAADLEGFRIAYLWPQITGIDPELLRREVYPRSARVNDALEAKLEADRAAGALAPELHPRVLANLAWTTAHGILSLVSSLERTGGSTRTPLSQLRDEAAALLRRSAAVPPKPARRGRAARRT